MSNALKDMPLDELRRQLAAVKRMNAAALARDSLLEYMRFMMPDPEAPDDPDRSQYSVQPHHRVIAEGLESVARGQCLRLAISVPPQHGKSQLTTRGFPSWHEGKYPWKNLMIGSYNQDFANEFGADVRALIKSPLYQTVFPHAVLRTGSSATDHMVMVQGGKLAFLGRGGSGTGRPADGVIIDDPIKDRKEADSLTIRNDVWNWFTSVMNTRIHGASWIIIIQTRWSDDDLIGRLTDPKNKHYNEKVAKQWTYINLPAIQDDAEIAALMGKKVGDALWPERFPLPLLETAKALDPEMFSALYQGKPTPPEGSFFKRKDIHTYSSLSEIPANVRAYGAGDLAVSPDRNADSSVVGNALLDENDTIWIHPNLYWEKKSADESVEQIIDFAETFKWHDSFFEKGQLARAVGPFLDKRAFERKVVLNTQMFPATGSKGSRAMSARGRMRQGKILFPAFAPWWERALDQLLKFTGTGDDPEDDFCDFVGMVGQGLPMQISASALPDKENVVKVGSLRWIRAQAERERKAAEKHKRVAHV